MLGSAESEKVRLISRKLFSKNSSHKSQTDTIENNNTTRDARQSYSATSARTPVIAVRTTITDSCGQCGNPCAFGLHRANGRMLTNTVNKKHSQSANLRQVAILTFNHVTIWFVMRHILWVLHCNRVCVCCFRDIRPITVRHSSADTVVRAMNVFNGKRRFGGLTAPKPFDGLSRNLAQLIMSATPPHMQMYMVNRFQGGVSAHAWNCRVQASIFSLFLSPMRQRRRFPPGCWSGPDHFWCL